MVKIAKNIQMIVNAFIVIFMGAISHVDGRSSPRIIGGYEINITAAPYTVAVYDFATKSLCGGTVLSEKFVATAAHCISTTGQNVVLAGSTYLGDGQLIRAKAAIPHPDFKELAIVEYNDYGLIVLEEPLVFNENVSAIPMAQGTPPVDTMMLATGWGLYDKNDDDIAPKLRAVQLPTVTDDACRTLFEGEQHDSILCAGYIGTAKSVYLGDSGGPLVYNNTLYGIASFVYEPKAPAYPSGFARVSYGYNWFVKTMQENM